MKRYIFLIPLVFLTQLASAQGLKSEDHTTTNLCELRVAAQFTKHFKHPSMSLFVSQEIYSRLYESTYSQLDDQTTNQSPYFRRSYTTAGLSYEPIEYLRLGCAYTLKVYGNKLTTTDGTTVSANEYLRHRASIFVSGEYTIDEWKFSLREKLDATIRTDSVNRHEKPQTNLILRHRLMAQYSVPGRPLKAYASVELWNTLNQPVNYLNQYAGTSNSGTATAYAGQTNPFGQYLSEVRAQAGIKWRVDRLNTLSLAYRFTYGYSRDVNITHNKGHIELTHAKSFGHYIILSYDLDW